MHFIENFWAKALVQMRYRRYFANIWPCWLGCACGKTTVYCTEGGYLDHHPPICYSQRKGIRCSCPSECLNLSPFNTFFPYLHCHQPRPALEPNPPKRIITQKAAAKLASSPHTPTMDYDSLKVRLRRCFKLWPMVSQKAQLSSSWNSLNITTKRWC